MFPLESLDTLSYSQPCLSSNGCSDEDDDVREMCLEWVEEGLRLQEGEEHPLLLLLQQRK